MDDATVSESRPSLARPGISVRAITTAGLLAALLSASAYFSLPIGAVPVTLQVLIVILAALLLGPAEAALAVGVYLLAGAIGLPVFAGAKGGLGVLVGPTGGYLLGFLLGATAAAATRVGLERAKAPQLAADVIAAVIVLVLVYVLGPLQLAFVAHLAPGAALTAGVVPFVVPDVAKAAVAIALATAIRRAAPGSSR